MALHVGKKKKLTVTALDAKRHPIDLESETLTDPNLELVPADPPVQNGVNIYWVRPSEAYDGTTGLSVPVVFVADGRAGEGAFPVSVDLGTETLFPGDVVTLEGAIVGDEEDDV